MGDIDAFIGKWEVTGTENMEEMLKAFDMEESKRKMYSEMRFTMEYVRDGDDWTYTVYMPNGMSKTYKYTIGKEFDSQTLDGRPIISVVDVKDGKFVEIHRDKDDPKLDATMTREVDGNQLTVFMGEEMPKLQATQVRSGPSSSGPSSSVARVLQSQAASPTTPSHHLHRVTHRRGSVTTH